MCELKKEFSIFQSRCSLRHNTRGTRPTVSPAVQSLRISSSIRRPRNTIFLKKISSLSNYKAAPQIPVHSTRSGASLGNQDAPRGIITLIY